MSGGDLFEPTTSRTRREVQGKGTPRRSRRYEREHPSYRWRTSPDDLPRIQAIADELSVSRDHVVSAVLSAGLDAVEDGRLVLTVSKEIAERRDAAGRQRSYVVTEVGAEWNGVSNGNTGGS